MKDKHIMARWLVSLLLVCLASGSLTAQNMLSVQQFTAAAGKEASLPIYLSNSVNIVGLQFDITLPYAKSVSTNVTLAGERCNGHTLSLRKLSDKKYTVVVMSMQNKPLRGNEGLLVRFPIQIPAEAQADDEISFSLSNIVLTNVNGKNVADETTSEAIFTVLRTPTPDFIVNQLLIDNEGETLQPGGQMRLKFNVKNQGTGDSQNGWTEKIYLEDATGYRSYVATQSYGTPLVAGEQVERLYEVTLPTVAKTDGDVRAVVELAGMLRTDELVADQGNNSGTSENTKVLARRLFLSKSRVALPEGSSTTLTLTRSGDWSMAETFTLAESNDVDSEVKQLSIPATVTIPAKSSAKSFTVTAPDNSTVNTVYRSTLTVSGNDYPDVTADIDVEDDDNRALTLTASKAIADEGEELTLTATVVRTPTSDLTVNIANTSAGRFYPYLRTITIPAGQTTGSGTTKVVDDNLAMSDINVTFTATATGYDKATATVTLKDNDRPRMTMTIPQNIISEGDGYQAATATVTREGSTAENLTIYINTNAGRELFFDSQYIIIPAGAASVTFPVSVEDNSAIDGERTWTITAVACDASTGKPFPTGSETFCSAQVKVTDNDSDRQLKLSCGVATLEKGGSPATVTLERNDAGDALTVQLASDDECVTVPATVTFASGSKKTTFTVQAPAGSETSENHFARVTATATGYQSAQFVFMVSLKPDVVCAAPVLPTGQPYGGQRLTITLPVSNKGTANLEPGMEVRFFVTTDKYYNPNSEYRSESDFFRTTLPEGVPAGQTVNMEFDVTMPMYIKEQQYYLMAWLNPMQKMVESNYYNNMSGLTPLCIVPPFTLSEIKADRNTYTRGDAISFTGRMSNEASGIGMEGCRVDVFLKNDTKCYRTTATLDAEGSFTAQYVVGEQAGGRYLTGACVSGTGGTDTKGHINVAQLKIERSNYLMKDVTEGVPLEGDIAITNLSEEPVKNVKFRMDDLPEDWTVELTDVASLSGGATGNAHYRIVPTQPKGAGSFVSGTFVVSAQDTDGNAIGECEMPVYFNWKAATSKMLTDGTLKTTLYREGERTYDIKVSNIGLKETGEITVEWPSASPWLAATAATMPSIPAGGSGTLTLLLKGQPGMLIDGTYTSNVRLTCKNGEPMVQEVKVTAVSTDKGQLTVDVVDAYTMADENDEGPHVGNASVRLTNALTGEVVMTGTTAEDGRYRVEALKEGTYYVYATAANHYCAEKTITVNPGMENQVQMFLNYETVKVTYTVERTTVTDEYQTVLTMDIVPDIPQAIVVPDLPASWGVGEKSFSVTLTNKGRLTAYTPFLEFPQIDGYSFTVKSDYPAVIYPNESYDVTIDYKGPEAAGNTLASYIVMHYAYKMRGEMHWGQETYLATLGTGDIIFPYGGGLPVARSDAEGRNFGTYSPPKTFQDDGLFFIIGGLDDLEIAEPEVNLRDYSKSIDNRVRLQFKQNFCLEREAFKGTLTVENLQMGGIEHIEMTPSVKRTDGTDASDLFAITITTPDDNWQLGSSQTGQATVLYVPSKETAPTEPVDYLFGGTLTYRDVNTTQMVTIELTPTQLTVNPSPDLHLTYFVQRNFIGDDPLTDEVEPWEPAQFALLIQNKGAGEALNLSIKTSDPGIVDNVNNLPVKFTKLYCTVDGEQTQQSFNEVDLGKIAAGQNIMLHWWYYCNVMAYVANYEVQMLKHSLFGEEFDLITIDGVKELTGIVNGTIPHATRSPMRRAQAIQASGDIMLLNLIEDEDNMPDYVMDSNGNGTDDLEIVSDKAVFTKSSDATFTLAMTSSRQGWVYGVTQDPTNCTMNLTKVIRQSDGADVTANFWQTNRSVTSNNSVIAENRLHWADNINASETYVLTYEKKPAPAPQVKSIALLTDEGETLATRAVVTFAEDIDAASFSGADVVLTDQGGKQHSVSVTQQGDKQFTLDWTGGAFPGGECAMTVYTSGITNSEGISGTTNKSLLWTAALTGDVDGNGVVDTQDAIKVVQRYLNRQPANFNEQPAHVTDDAVIDTQDAIHIIKLYLKK